MTRFNQAIVASASSIALFAGALALITPSAEAQGYYGSQGYGSNAPHNRSNIYSSPSHGRSYYSRPVLNDRNINSGACSIGYGCR